MGRGYSFQSFFLYIDFKTKRYYTFQQFKERGLGEREREGDEKEGGESAVHKSVRVQCLGAH